MRQIQQWPMLPPNCAPGLLQRLGHFTEQAGLSRIGYVSLLIQATKLSVTIVRRPPDARCLPKPLHVLMAKVRGSSLEDAIQGASDINSIYTTCRPVRVATDEIAKNCRQATADYITRKLLPTAYFRITNNCHNNNTPLIQTR